VAKAPENGEFRFSLARAYEKPRRIPESLAAYEAYLKRAGDSDPKAKVVREQLAIAKKAPGRAKPDGSAPRARRKGVNTMRCFRTLVLTTLVLARLGSRLLAIAC
jgi:hypothetical protein